MDKAKCWVKNVIKKLQLKVKVEITQHLALSIFDPTQHFLECMCLFDHKKMRRRTQCELKLFSNKMQTWELLNKIETCVSYRIPSSWKFVTGS